VKNVTPAWVNMKMAVFWTVKHQAVQHTSTDVSEVLAASIISVMIETGRTTETVVNSYQTTWH
jgi:hypothetical protein